MIVIIDYGVGNLFSLESSLKSLNQDVIVSSKKEDIINADKLILPGVGAFKDAINKLKENDLDKLVISQAKQGKYLLGICLGMQLLFDKSYEYGEYEGLHLIEGEILPISDFTKDVKIPHIGWNKLNFEKDSPLFKYINDGDYVYFVHSYFAYKCDEAVSSTTDYGIELTASVEKNNIFGCQFHPEKSGNVGLNILKAFCEME